MKRFSILVFCSISVFAISFSTVNGQTAAPGVQNGDRAAGNSRPHATGVHRNAPSSQNVIRTPASIGPGMINSRPIRENGQTATNLRSSNSPFSRPLNPTLAEMSARQSARIDNVESIPGIRARREIARTALPIANTQPVVKNDNLQPTGDDLVGRQISEGPEAIEAYRIAKNKDAQPITRDLANHETKRHPRKWNQPNGNNRSTYFDALRRHRHEWHNRDWWRQHCNTIVLVGGGYYFLDAGYWYPALGYDPLSNYYDYDGPIYTYGNLLPDEVIANVQLALQEAGYYGGPITGSLGVETRAALANYQRDQGLLITGAIDEPTIESLGLY
jgi:Putative peptidoglycan binding domain